MKPAGPSSHFPTGDSIETKKKIPYKEVSISSISIIAKPEEKSERKPSSDDDVIILE